MADPILGPTKGPPLLSSQIQQGWGHPPEVFGLGYCARGMMKGRIAIPIHDETDALVGYAGRWPGDPAEGEERYKLPPGFKKSRVLYNCGFRSIVISRIGAS